MITIKNPTQREQVLLIEIEMQKYQIEKTELLCKIRYQKITPERTIDLSKRLHYVLDQIVRLKGESLTIRNEIYNLIYQIQESDERST